MNQQLLFALIQLAMRLPQLAADIKALVTHSGVSEQQYEDAAHILAQNPNAYFEEVFAPVQPGRPTVVPPPNVQPPKAQPPYDTAQDGTLPPDADLRAMGFARGDWKWTAADNSARWIVGHSGGALGADWQFQGSVQ